MLSPDMMLNAELQVAINREFSYAGYESGQCEPNAVNIPNVTPKEKNTCETAVDQTSG